MTKQILLSAQELRAARESTECVIVDCRFVLDDLDAGFEDYLESHIPGAVYAHLEDDLSSPASVKSGRHPLPDKDKFAAFLSRSGWQPGALLVAYDDAGGAIASRLWWLMRYFGHDCAALLDGGIPAWWAAGFELERGQADADMAADLVAENLNASDELVISTSEIIESLDKDAIVLAHESKRYFQNSGGSPP
jgi:thiosulfate/3-mercaptopyruvate sulfurtransferase